MPVQSPEGVGLRTLAAHDTVDAARSIRMPVIRGTGIRTEIVAERYAAGESAIEDAIRSEFPVAA